MEYPKSIINDPVYTTTKHTILFERAEPPLILTLNDRGNIKLSAFHSVEKKREFYYHLKKKSVICINVLLNQFHGKFAKKERVWNFVFSTLCHSSSTILALQMLLLLPYNTVSTMFAPQSSTKFGGWVQSTWKLILHFLYDAFPDIGFLSYVY